MSQARLSTILFDPLRVFAGESFAPGDTPDATVTARQLTTATDGNEADAESD